MLTKRFEQALLYAKQLHDTQQRKGTGVPYIAHLLGVAALTLEYGGNEDEAIAALLHDAVEDQGGLPTLDEIRRRFGDRVAHIVEGCTDSDETPKPPWKERKVAYIEHVRTALPSVVLVSAADKLHNARALVRDHEAVGDAVWSRFNGGPHEILWYYRSLVESFKAAGSMPVVDELERVVDRIEAIVPAGS